MGSRLTSFLGYVGAFAIIGVAGWAIIRGVEEDPSVVGSLATALAAVLAVVYGRQREKKLDLEQSHREVLTPFYEELIDRFRGFKQPTPQEAEQFFQQFSGKLLLNGSDRVIKAWVALQRKEIDPGKEVDVEAMLAWERVIRAIRADLGHSGSDLAPGDLLRVYMNEDLPK